MSPLQPNWLLSHESNAIFCPLGDQSGAETPRPHGVSRLSPFPSIPTTKIDEMQPFVEPASFPCSLSLQPVKRVNTIRWPSGETCGSKSSNSMPAGIVVTRVASSFVTPSGSDDGISQISEPGPSPQSVAIASWAPLGV